jgi:hypothetical protein
MLVCGFIWLGVPLSGRRAIVTRSNFWEEKDGIFEISPGANITDTIAEGIRKATKEARVIRFEFNGVIVAVAGDSDRKLLYRDWQRALSGYIDKTIGPYPASALSDKERANDARLESEQAAKRAKVEAAYQARDRAKRTAIETKLAGAPPIALSDTARWQDFVTKNTDPYGGAVVTYAERWARLMQLAMANGNALETVAEPTSQEADLEGLTGFMYGCAVKALAHCWQYGEQLRRWHNLKTQLRDEGTRANESGGVLNPAVLVLGGDK